MLIYKLFDVYRITYTQYFRRYFGVDADSKTTRSLNDLTYRPRMKGYKNKIISATNRNFFRIIRQMYDNLIKQNTEEKINNYQVEYEEILNYIRVIKVKVHNQRCLQKSIILMSYEV